MNFCYGLGAGAIQLMQMQEDLRKRIEGGQMQEQGMEAYLQSKQDLMIGNLWKLNVADIENTLTNVCQKVCALTAVSHSCHPLLVSNGGSVNLVSMESST